MTKRSRGRSTLRAGGRALGGRIRDRRAARSRGDRATLPGSRRFPRRRRRAGARRGADRPRADRLDCVVADGHKWLCAPEGAGFMALSEACSIVSSRSSSDGRASSTGEESFYPYDLRLRRDAAKLEAGSLEHHGDSRSGRSGRAGPRGRRCGDRGAAPRARPRARRRALAPRAALSRAACATRSVRDRDLRSAGESRSGFARISGHAASSRGFVSVASGWLRITTRTWATSRGSSSATTRPRRRSDGWTGLRRWCIASGASRGTSRSA